MGSVRSINSIRAHRLDQVRLDRGARDWLVNAGLSKHVGEHAR
jgi:hypothetical protein